jgi:hypothetical protein
VEYVTVSMIDSLWAERKTLSTWTRRHGAAIAEAQDAYDRENHGI